MVTLAFDSSTLIDVMRGRNPRIRQTFAAMNLRQVAPTVPVVVVHELISGADMGGNPAGERGKVERVLRGLTIAPLEPADVEFTAKVRSSLKGLGRSIGDIDTLIAGQALARGWTLVTRNVRHFGRVEGLPLIDWSLGPDPLTREQIAERVAADAP